MADEQHDGKAPQAPAASESDAAPPEGGEAVPLTEADVDAMDDAQAVKALEQVLAESDAEGEPPAEPAKKEEPDKKPEPDGGGKAKEPPKGKEDEPDKGTDPVAALKTENEELKKQLEQARKPPAQKPGEPSDQQPPRGQQPRQGDVPQWATIPADEVILPQHPGFGPYAGMKVGNIANLNADAYTAVKAHVEQEQLKTRAYHAGLRQAQERLARQQQEGALKAGWEAYEAEYRKANPSATPEQVKEHLDGVLDYASKYRFNPADFVKVRDFDAAVKAAEERGKKAGREELAKELEKSSQAPQSVDTGRKPAPDANDPLARFVGKSARQIAQMLEDMSEKEFEKLNVVPGFVELVEKAS